jgi:hypothetical protein
VTVEKPVKSFLSSPYSRSRNTLVESEQPLWARQLRANTGQPPASIPSAFSIQHSAFSIQHSAFNVQHSPRLGPDRVVTEPVNRFAPANRAGHGRRRQMPAAHRAEGASRPPQASAGSERSGEPGRGRARCDPQMPTEGTIVPTNQLSDYVP